MWTSVVCFASILAVKPPTVCMLGPVVSEEELYQSTFQCSEGHFRCGEAEDCVEQKHICDDIIHCSNGWDEELHQCIAVPALLHFWVTNLTNIPANFSAQKVENLQNECELTTVPSRCRCATDSLYCNGTELQNIPEDISQMTARMQIYDNKIQSLGTGTFKNLHRLTFLNFRWNEISHIEPGAFDGLDNLKTLILSDNKIESIQSDTFRGMSKLLILWLNHNKLRSLGSNTFSNLPALRDLFLDHNSISVIDGRSFQGLNSLIWLDLASNEMTFSSHGMPTIDSLRILNLGENRIQRLKKNTFVGYRSLHTLELHNNGIKSMDSNVFGNMNDLQDLTLSSNEIGQLPETLFIHNTHLHTIQLNDNPLESLPVNIFHGLHEAKILDLSGVTIDNIQPELFQDMTNLHHVYFKSFQYCAYAPHVPVCYPKSDGISSLENLLGISLLRVCIWVVAFLTTVGNIFVMVTRSLLKEENRSHSLLVRNLCGSDLMMGVYLVIIGVQDIRFREEYNAHAYSWMVSWGCQCAGALGMLSSEVSILLLTYMSVERYIIISNPYRPWKMSYKSTVLCVVFIWVLGLIFSIIPLLAKDTFGVFYGTNGLCFPLHIHEPHQTGWKYSAFVFLGVNLCAIFVTSAAYLGMFMQILNTRKRSSVCSDEDTFIARRIFWIVLTDSLCWIPIIVIKILALVNIPISDDAYAWLAVFVLPINSAINPLLYSLTAATFRRKLNLLLSMKRRNSDIIRVMVKMVRRHPSTCSRLSVSTRLSTQVNSNELLDLQTIQNLVPPPEFGKVHADPILMKKGSINSDTCSTAPSMSGQTDFRTAIHEECNLASIPMLDQRTGNESLVVSTTLGVSLDQTEFHTVA